MQVSSYLEAFLTVYGWDMYYVLYLLFASIGLFLYPILRILNDIYINYISGSEYAGTNYLRQLIASLMMALLVFFLAVVPVQSIDLGSTTVKTVCESTAASGLRNYNARDSEGNTYFTLDSTRVPMMPWLAMSIGQGIAGVIYQKAPCVLDVTDAQSGMMNVNLDSADNPELLKAELNRFVQQCHLKAVNLTRAILKDAKGMAYGEQAYSVLNSKLQSIKASTGKSEAQILGNYDSEFIKDMFYSSSSPLSSTQGNSAITPLIAEDAVVGYNGYESNGSGQQTSTAPSCMQWWSEGSGSTQALRLRVLAGLTASAVANVAKHTNIPECKTNTGLYGSSSTYNGYNPYGIQNTSVINPDTCKAAVVDQIYSGDSSTFDSDLFAVLQGGGATDQSVGVGSNIMAAVGLGIGGVASKFGIDIGQGAVVSSMVSFYVYVLMLQKLLEYILPMILMTIYMFWGVFLIIGEFRGMTMIRGMTIISLLSLIPALWAVMEHIDDGLYSALYSGADWWNAIDRVYLDMAVSIFQLGIVSVVFFLVTLGGGGDARGAVGESQSMGGQAGRGLGQGGGGTVNKWYRWGTYGSRDGGGNLQSGGFIQRGYEGLKGGFGRFKK